MLESLCKSSRDRTDCRDVSPLLTETSSLLAGKLSLISEIELVLREKAREDIRRRVEEALGACHYDEKYLEHVLQRQHFVVMPTILTSFVTQQGDGQRRILISISGGEAIKLYELLATIHVFRRLVELTQKYDIVYVVLDLTHGINYMPVYAKAGVELGVSLACIYHHLLSLVEGDSLRKQFYILYYNSDPIRPPRSQEPYIDMSLKLHFARILKINTALAWHLVNSALAEATTKVLAQDSDSSSVADYLVPILLLQVSLVPLAVAYVLARGEDIMKKFISEFYEEARNILSVDKCDIRDEGRVILRYRIRGEFITKSITMLLNTILISIAKQAKHSDKKYVYEHNNEVCVSTEFAEKFSCILGPLAEVLVKRVIVYDIEERITKCLKDRQCIKVSECQEISVTDKPEHRIAHLALAEAEICREEGKLYICYDKDKLEEYTRDYVRRLKHVLHR